MGKTSVILAAMGRVLVMGLACTPGVPAVRAVPAVGAVLPPPLVGGLDIHHINTGEGNAALLVLPDRTTLLIDCGSNRGMARLPRFKAPSRPDGSRLPGEWVARYVRRVHPRGADAPVDVLMLNHHGNSDATSPFFVSVLQPRVCVAQVWDAQQVDPIVLGRLRSELLAPGPRDIFMTNGEWEGRDEHVVRVFGEVAGRKHVEDLKTIAARQGHVVVRVAPGGASYDVIVLTDADESMRVRSVHGPYASR
jgi:hypothetical protein